MTGRETLQDKLRARARRGAPRLQPLLLPPPADEEYWERLSDILQVDRCALRWHRRCALQLPNGQPLLSLAVVDGARLFVGAGAGRH